MFVNFTNHPMKIWSEAQTEAAREYGEIAEIPFPNVPPENTEDDVSIIAEEYVEKIMALEPEAVLCQGEMTLTYAVVSRLIKKGVPVLAACSERMTEEVRQPDGSVQKVSRFVFRGFRRYG